MLGLGLARRHPPPPRALCVAQVNTCAHMGLIAEAVCHHSLRGRRLPRNLHVLAALNPYRFKCSKPRAARSSGLMLRSGGASAASVDPMAALVYRVHPVPETLTDLIFDFGALTKERERRYIESMASEALGLEGASQSEVGAVTALVSRAHEVVRGDVGDSSAVSLRDVKRFLKLLDWFKTNFPKVLACLYVYAKKNRQLKAPHKDYARVA